MGSTLNSPDMRCAFISHHIVARVYKALLNVSFTSTISDMVLKTDLFHVSKCKVWGNSLSDMNVKKCLL